MLRLPPQEGFQNAPLKSPLRDPPACHRTAGLPKSIAQIKNAALQLPNKFKSVKDVLAQTVKDVLAVDTFRRVGYRIGRTRLKLYRFMTSLTLRARTSLTLFPEG